MRISHFVGHSLVRYTPGRIATYWGRYTDHEARAFAITRPGENLFHEPLNPSGFYCSKSSPKKWAREWVRSSDVIHCHDDCYPSRVALRLGVDLSGKVLVYHAHIGNIPDRYFSKVKKFSWDPRVRHVAITNGYGHLFDEHTRDYPGRVWGRLPDVLDIYHPTYAPDSSLRPPIDSRRLRVCYTYSNRHENAQRVNAKRPKAHIRILDSIDCVDAVFVHGRPFDESMAEKKKSHVVIEECFTPYLHLSALEGACAGRCVVTKFNDATVEETSRAIGAPIDEWPFVYADEDTLESTLVRLNKSRGLVEEIGMKSREWVERYYNPGRLLKQYEELYEGKARENVGDSSRG